MTTVVVIDEVDTDNRGITSESTAMHRTCAKNALIGIFYVGLHDEL